jgi:hypothetical protein
MNLAKLAAGAGRLNPDAFDELREKFNFLHEWAVVHLDEDALREAVRNLDARNYAPPVAEEDRPFRPSRAAESSAAETVAMVDAVRDQALALGWAEEDLYPTPCAAWAHPWIARQLACLLRPGDRIGEVAGRFIEIVRASGARQRFYNPAAAQPWVTQLRGGPAPAPGPCARRGA